MRIIGACIVVVGLLLLAASCATWDIGSHFFGSPGKLLSAAGVALVAVGAWMVKP